MSANITVPQGDSIIHLQIEQAERKRERNSFEKVKLVAQLAAAGVLAFMGYKVVNSEIFQFLLDGVKSTFGFAGDVTDVTADSISYLTTGKRPPAGSWLYQNQEAVAASGFVEKLNDVLTTQAEFVVGNVDIAGLVFGDPLTPGSWPDTIVQTIKTQPEEIIASLPILPGIQVGDIGTFQNVGDFTEAASSGILNSPLNPVKAVESMTELFE